MNTVDVMRKIIPVHERECTVKMAEVRRKQRHVKRWRKAGLMS